LEVATCSYAAFVPSMGTVIRISLGVPGDRNHPAVNAGCTSLLCCGERKITGAGCHRRLWADWWTARTGEEVPELDGTASSRL
jgi:hypothetical protein